MTFHKLGDGENDWLDKLNGKSGVYVIRERDIWGLVLYVGESHTNNLRKTLLRHFQKWTGPTAGPTFNRSEVEIGVLLCPSGEAVAKQNALIAEYEPEFNTASKPDWLAV